MGYEALTPLGQSNILTHHGPVQPGLVSDLGKKLSVDLPQGYVRFVTEYNGASLKTKDCFDFYNVPRRMLDTDSLAFLRIEQISEDIQDLSNQNEPQEEPPYFEAGLVPFGENGGGDFICFDYRQDPKTDDPPVVLWSHDVADNSLRISFIANNFEEFVNMLHEPEDE